MAGPVSETWNYWYDFQDPLLGMVGRSSYIATGTTNIRVRRRLLLGALTHTSYQVYSNRDARRVLIPTVTYLLLQLYCAEFIYAELRGSQVLAKPNPSELNIPSPDDPEHHPNGAYPRHAGLNWWSKYYIPPFAGRWMEAVMDRFIERCDAAWLRTSNMMTRPGKMRSRQPNHNKECR